MKLKITFTITLLGADWTSHVWLFGTKHSSVQCQGLLVFVYFATVWAAEVNKSSSELVYIHGRLKQTCATTVNG